MALHTDDITITKDWQEVALLDSGTFVQAIYTGIETVYARVDANSTSVGIRLDKLQQLKSPESIYIKSAFKDVTIQVIRDGDE